MARSFKELKYMNKEQYEQLLKIGFPESILIVARHVATAIDIDKLTNAFFELKAATAPNRPNDMSCYLLIAKCLKG